MKKTLILLMLFLLAFSCSEAPSILKVSYHGEDGSVFSQEDVLKGAKASNRAWDQECACTDHGVFLFWSEDKQSAFDFSKPIEKSVELYPVFDTEKHSVSLIDAEASGFGTEYYSGTQVTLPDVEKEGFAFAGWETDVEIRDGIFIMPTRDVSVKAIWEKAYLLSFGGKADAMNLREGETIELPSPEGIIAWQHGENEYLPGSVFTMPGSDTELLAVPGYILTIVIGENQTTDLYREGETVTLPSPDALKGHTFKGWKNGDTELGNAGSFVMPSANTTLEAVYEKNIYSVTYTSDGDEPVVKQYEYGSDVDLGQLFRRDGYEIKGWTLPDSSALIISLTMPDYDITLKAVWQVRSYRIISYSFEGVDESKLAPRMDGPRKVFYTAADKGEYVYIEKSSIERPGYELVRYDILGSAIESHNDKYSRFLVGDEDIAVKGVYRALPQDLIISLNDGSGIEYREEVKTGESIRYNEKPYARPGYDFGYWAYDADGIEKYSPDDAMPPGGVTIYAIWKEKQKHTLSFVFDDPSYSIGPRTYYEGETVDLSGMDWPAIENYQHDGYAFLDPSIDAPDGVFKMPGKDVAVKPIYKRIMVSVRCYTDKSNSIFVKIEIPKGDPIKPYVDSISIEKEKGKAYTWYIAYTGSSSKKLGDQVMASGINHLYLETTVAESRLELLDQDGVLIASRSSVPYGKDISGYMNESSKGIDTILYEFECWETDDASFDGSTMPDHDLTLKAVVSDKVYSFSFLPDEWSLEETRIGVKCGESISYPDYIRSGYYIHGWHVGNYSIDTPPETLTRNAINQYFSGNAIVVYPEWRAKTEIDVVYSYGGESRTVSVAMGDDVFDPKYVDGITGAISSPAEVERGGMIGGVWYTKYIARGEVSVDLELRAREYNAAFYIYENNTSDAMIEYSVKSIPFGESVVPPEMPERDGYDFRWDDHVPDTMPHENLRIRGRYLPKPGFAIVHESPEINIISPGAYTALELKEGIIVPSLPAAPSIEGKSFAMYITEAGSSIFEVREGDTFFAGIEVYPLYSDYTFSLDRRNLEAAVTGKVDPLSEEDIAIPSRIGEYTVTSIAPGAFEGERSGCIKSVVIPSSIALIGEEAFSHSSVERVEFAGGSSPVSIKGRAFRYAEKLSVIEMPVLYSLDGPAVFSGCSSLKEFQIPPFIESVPASTFALSGLSVLTIENGVRNIGTEAFYMADSLTQVRFPDSMRTIGDYAFSGDVWGVTHSGLMDVVFNEGLEEIGVCAFRNTSAASYVTPDSLRRIGTAAFSDCDNLEYAYLGKSLEMVYDGYEDGVLIDAGGPVFTSSGSLSRVLCGFGEQSLPRNFTQTLIDLDNNMGISPQYGKAKPQ